MDYQVPIASPEKCYETWVRGLSELIYMFCVFVCVSLCCGLVERLLSCDDCSLSLCGTWNSFLCCFQKCWWQHQRWHHRLVRVCVVSCTLCVVCLSSYWWIAYNIWVHFYFPGLLCRNQENLHILLRTNLEVQTTSILYQVRKLCSSMFSIFFTAYSFVL